MTVSAPPPAPDRPHTEGAAAGPVARHIFQRAVGLIPVRATWPDGRRIGGGGAEAPEFQIVRPGAFFARLGRDTNIGVGEAYMAGDWKAAPGTDLADLLTPFAANLTGLVPRPLQRLRGLVDRPIPPQHENTIAGSRDNIRAHYDLSNDLFAAFLDPTLSYSSAWFAGAEPIATATDLEAAQLRKIDGVLDHGPRGGGRPGAGDRNRLGDAGHPGRAARRAGDQRDHLRPSS